MWNRWNWHRWTRLKSCLPLLAQSSRDLTLRGPKVRLIFSVRLSRVRDLWVQRLEEIRRIRERKTIEDKRNSVFRVRMWQRVVRHHGPEAEEQHRKLMRGRKLRKRSATLEKFIKHLAGIVRNNCIWLSLVTSMLARVRYSGGFCLNLVEYRRGSCTSISRRAKKLENSRSHLLGSLTKQAKNGNFFYCLLDSCVGIEISNERILNNQCFGIKIAKIKMKRYSQCWKSS